MKKIPTLAGLTLVLVLVAITAVTTNLVKNVTNIFSRADTSLEFVVPVKIANITDTGLTVYWVTGSKTVGSVLYGVTTALGDGVALDERANEKYITHFVRVTNLKPSTSYYFRSTDSPDSQSPLKVETLSSDSVKSAEPIFGKVLESDGTSAQGAIIVMDKFAALAKSDGSYVLPVTDLPPGQAETITVYSVSGVATINCKSGQDRPLPTVSIGNNVDCSKNTGATGFKVPESQTPVSSAGGELEVTLRDGETVSTPLPTISGKAGPSQMVKIVVNSQTPYSGVVKADNAGNWSWTPPTNLASGEHTATITITNPDGTTQIVTRKFVVAANSPILPITSGTPSADLTHNICINQSCVKVSGEGTGTCLLDTDCVLAPPPVATPSPTPPPAPPPVAPPSTGALENTMILLVAGFVLISLGAGLLIL